MSEKQNLSRNWSLMVFVLFILGAILRQDGLVLIALLASIVTGVAWLWNRLVLQQVTYTRKLTAERAFAGEQVSLSVALTNAKLLPVPWLRADDAFSENLQLLGGKLRPSSIPGRVFLSHLATLGPHERLRWHYEIDCTQRGFYFLGPTDIQSGDALGFFAQRRQLEASERLIVYPRVLPLPELGFPGKDPFGEQKTPRHIIQDPTRTVGVRDYHPEDSLRHVHWKASARQAELQVKVYEPVITQQLVIFLNVATFAQPWLGTIPERQEQAISVAASIASHATERRYAVGLIANGSFPKADQAIKVPPGRAPDQLTHILEALAAVTGFATSTIEELMIAQSPRLDIGATLVLVTTVVSEELLGMLLRLQDVGRRIVLVSMDPQYDTSPPGILTHHIPLAEADFAGVWKRAVQEEPADEELGRVP